MSGFADSNGYELLMGRWSMLLAAELEHVREDPILIETRFESFGDFWAPILGGVGPSASYATSLAPAKQQALAARLRAELWETRPQESRTFPARAWAVAGTVPLAR